MPDHDVRGLYERAAFEVSLDGGGGFVAGPANAWIGLANSDDVGLNPTAGTARTSVDVSVNSSVACPTREKERVQRARASGTRR